MKRGFLNNQKTKKPKPVNGNDDTRMGPLQDSRIREHEIRQRIKANWQGGNFLTGHVQSEQAHSWNGSGNTRLPRGVKPPLGARFASDWSVRSHEPKRVKTTDLEDVPMEEATTDLMQVEDATIQTASAAQVSSEPTAINPFQGTPFYPTSMFGSPKLALNVLYGKEMKEMTQLTNESFFHWDDQGPPHKRKFTCVFVCPVTYERFPASRSGKASKFVVDEQNGIVWFAQKKLAEQGAAARRHDCFVYCKCCAMDPTNQNVPRAIHWGLDPPYKPDEAPKVLIPEDVEKKIEAQVIEWKKEAVIRKQKERAKQLALEQRAMEVDEAALERQSYREQRLFPLEKD
jgi:hypothetical protein